MCIFCKIVNNEIPSYKVWEDERHLAFLDINPNTPGMILVITKQHFDSDAFEMPDNAFKDLLLAAKKVAKIMKKALNVNRVAMVMEGMGVNHVHIKLYPMYGVDKEFKAVEVEHFRVFYDKYPGFITTLLGPRADDKELEEIANKIRAVAKKRDLIEKIN